uniref:BPTI/Kunitz inhibitor domain-containing protein n=1 Tax=Chromera velia CCMP2878 TaxID=1169474 RepID=A0A0G4GIS1_9ALVE
MKLLALAAVTGLANAALDFDKLGVDLGNFNLGKFGLGGIDFFGSKELKKKAKQNKSAKTCADTSDCKLELTQIVRAINNPCEAAAIEDDETWAVSSLTLHGCGGNVGGTLLDLNPDFPSDQTQDRRRLLAIDPVDKSVCKLPPDVGPCEAMITRWFFDPSSNSCQEFIFGGCEGNGNNFATEAECEAACQDVCALPREIGPCRAVIPSWYFDVSSQSCQLFNYGGCEGNLNRFPTQEACEEACPTPETSLGAAYSTLVLSDETNDSGAAGKIDASLSGPFDFIPTNDINRRRLQQQGRRLFVEEPDNALVGFLVDTEDILEDFSAKTAAGMGSPAQLNFTLGGCPKDAASSIEVMGFCLFTPQNANPLMEVRQTAFNSSVDFNVTTSIVGTDAKAKEDTVLVTIDALKASAFHFCEKDDVEMGDDKIGFAWVVKGCCGAAGFFEYKFDVPAEDCGQLS